MRELGYRPNSAARALRNGEFRSIGVIMFTLSTFGNTRTLDAIADRGRAQRVRDHPDAGAGRTQGAVTARSPGSASRPSTA